MIAGLYHSRTGDSQMAIQETDGIFERMKGEKIRWVDFQFTDLVGGLQHITVPLSSLDSRSFETGVNKLDGSSIKGFKEIHESDMVMKPDISTFAVLPFYPPEQRTARFIVDIYEGDHRERFSRDPRFVAQKASEYAKSCGYDATYWGPEPEFFVFDGIRITPTPLSARDSWAGAGYEIISREAPWYNDGGKETPIRFKEGYYPAPPQDTLVDFRNEAASILMDSFGLEVDAHHHEVATAGQCELNLHFDELVKMADSVTTMKYVLKNVAKRRGMVCTWMPKPVFGDNASGMHVHQSLWSGRKNVFFDPSDEYAEISQAGRYYIGGLMAHARALCAFTNPTTNSYRRLVPGYEAPVFIAWSKRNRSANIRIPMYERGQEKSKRLEYRTPDPSANIYLAEAAMLMAGIDGIKRKLEPGNPVDKDIYKLTEMDRRELGIKELPGSLMESIEELETDHDFLSPVFTEDLIERHIELKRDEHLNVAIRTTPYEIYRYMDI